MLSTDILSTMKVSLRYVMGDETENAPDVNLDTEDTAVYTGVSYRDYGNLQPNYI